MSVNILRSRKYFYIQFTTFEFTDLPVNVRNTDQICKKSNYRRGSVELTEPFCQILRYF